jgi:hypothetical protein
MTKHNQNQTGAGTALLICNNTSLDVQFHKLTKGVSSMFPTNYSHPITSAYLMNDNSVVGYCAQTREWLKWNEKGQLHSSLGRTRAAAAKLGDHNGTWCDNKMTTVEFTPADEGFAAARLEVPDMDAILKDRVDNMFKGRYINLVALTDDARSVSCQVWCNNQEQVDAAFAKLQSWCTPAEEKWHGRIVTAMAHDGHTKESKTFVRLNDLSTPFLNAMVEVDLGTAHLIAK